MPPSTIENLYLENKDLLAYLQRNGEISYKSQVDDTFKKVLLLACASNLEHQVSGILAEFASEASSNCTPLISFLKNKAISRQFHTYFEWDKNNGANKFFALFGEDMKNQIKADISSNEDLEKAIKSFLEIGNLRNTMVHEDYVSFYLDKTAEEVFGLYVRSLTFVDYLSDTLAKSVTRRGRPI